MHHVANEICEELDAITTTLAELAKNETPLTKSQGWNFLALSPGQISKLPEQLSTRIREAISDDISSQSSLLLGEVLKTVKAIREDMVPSLLGNLGAGGSPFLQSISYCDMLLGQALGWINVPPEALPPPLARKLTGMQRTLDTLMPQKAELEGKIQTIVEGYDAAEALPTTLQELKETQVEIRAASSAVSEILVRLKNNGQEGQKALEHIQKDGEEAAKIKDQIEEAHQIVTTKGLAAAFDARAEKLNNSLNLWVVWLALALVAVLLVGYFRLEAMKEALTAQPFNSTRVWVQGLLSLIGVGAPIWFAWIATKQISQRFRLAEDYAFKASVAKAYEGYKREAVRIDPEFAKALFASALTRLDEAPLRLVEMATHGSPAHEFANSSTVKALLNRATSMTRRVKKANEANPSPNATETGPSVVKAE